MQFQRWKRKWEDLDSDCLVNIFGRLEVESLLLDIPFVCKTWYQALRNPLCWQKLVFPADYYESRLANTYERSGLVQFVVSRSQRCATELQLPIDCTKEELAYISDECPALEFLALSSFDLDQIISDYIVKWKNLQILRTGSSLFMEDIVAQVALHCKNFIGLIIESPMFIHDELASEIVEKVPNIKYLILDGANIKKNLLMIILKGCKQLELLCVRDCEGFDEDDEDILKLASPIKDFRCQGSMAYNIEDDHDDHVSVDTDFLYNSS